MAVTKKELEEQGKDLDILLRDNGSNYDDWLNEKQKEAFAEFAKPTIKNLKEKNQKAEKEIERLKKELEKMKNGGKEPEEKKEVEGESDECDTEDGSKEDSGEDDEEHTGEDKNSENASGNNAGEEAKKWGVGGDKQDGSTNRRS